MNKNTAAGLLMGLIGLAALSRADMAAFVLVVATCALAVIAEELRDLGDVFERADGDQFVAATAVAFLSWLTAAGAILSLMF